MNRTLTGMDMLSPELKLTFSPLLASRIGLNEAIFLQQLEYWLQRSGKEREGRLWVYNTRSDWTQQFPFWSESTVKRTISSLRKQGLITIGNFNKMKVDKTNWYSVNYEVVYKITFSPDELREKPHNDALGQNDPSNGSKWPNDDWVKMTQWEGQVDPTNNHKLTTETTTEINNNYIVEIVTYLNDTTSKKYKASSDKTKKLIQTRLKEGFTVNDFKEVIFKKTKQWKGTQYEKFLRPETLFGTKFEGYLNEEESSSGNRYRPGDENTTNIW